MGDDFILFACVGVAIVITGALVRKCLQRNTEQSEEANYRTLASAPPWPSYSSLPAIQEEEDENPI